METQCLEQFHKTSFKAFILSNVRNRTMLIAACLSVIVQLTIYKFLYPYASFIHGDSFSYINAAEANLTINTYLIGYSKFLRLLSVFGKPDLFVVAVQYLLIQASVLLLVLSIFYFYRPIKLMQYIMLLIMTFNPLFLYLGNLISSDGLFLAISLLWFTTLIWIMHKPSKAVIYVQAIVLFVAFTLRYNSIMYPIITIIVFAISSLPIQKKVLGVGLSIILCGWFVSLTMYKYKRLTGHWQYSPFAGWQMANNAMYTYRYVDSTDRKPVPKQFAILDNMIRQYFDSTRDVKRFPIEAIKASTFYMWSPGLPLFRYRDEVVFKNDTISPELKKWASMGPIYKSYGEYIIKNYPALYLKHFVWPNSIKYYSPPVEFLQLYNSGNDYVPEEARRWFGYKTHKVGTRIGTKHAQVLEVYPILSGIINVLMLCCLLCYLILKGWQYNKQFNHAIIVGGSFWLLNAGFTIFASSAALRFQSFPITLTTLFVALLIGWLIDSMSRATNVTNEKRNNQSISVELA